MSRRIYTTHDESIDRALALATETGLVRANDSEAKKVRAMIEYAGERLAEKAEREERIAAYKILARDEDRSKAIRSSVLAAADHGIL